MSRPVSDRLLLLRDAVADASVLSRDYRDAALAMGERACGNLLNQLGELYACLAEDLHAGIADTDGGTPGVFPSASCQHLFAWHLAEDDGESNFALSQRIRATEDHLHGTLEALFDEAALPAILRNPVECGHATTADTKLRSRVARCLTPSHAWDSAAPYGAGEARSPARSTSMSHEPRTPRPADVRSPAARFTKVDADEVPTLTGLAEEGSPCDVAPPFDLDPHRPNPAERDVATRTCSLGLRNRVSPG
jgi:hypothetical protein